MWAHFIHLNLVRLLVRLLLLHLLSSTSAAVELPDYDYVVVGAGAGGGPLAARLAMAGHRTLLIDAGHDEGANVNYTVPAYSAKASEDESMAWNFFVRHYTDDDRQARDPKTSYETPDGRIYTGSAPPSGSRMIGILYPRSATLGGCTAHNALITIYPHRSDFDDLARLTGDASWTANRMRPYFVRLEHNRYLLPGARGHGFDGWLSTEMAPLTLALKDPQLLSVVLGGAFALGNLTKVVVNIASVLAGDANADTAQRDRAGGYFQTPISTSAGQRVGAREFIVAVRDARNRDGSKRYPLDVRTNCHVTKVVLDESRDEPRATGVEFLDGAYLYRASPRSEAARRGVPGSVKAKREVIVAGGTYNSPQILKLSGIGPADELARFGIKVVKDLPGVGENLQDHYEVAVQGRLPVKSPAFNGCTFGSDPARDLCLRQWEHPPLIGGKGPYVSNGVPASMLFKSSAASEYDTFVYGGPVNFRGYYPGYSNDATAQPDLFSWTVLKSHPRNRAGSVTLQSADPLDVPRISYNYFDTGSGDAEADMRVLREGVRLARDAFRRQLVPVTEVLPGAGVLRDQDIDTYVRDTAWGHHASSTCPIGPDGDPMAVLDSSFRVRGVRGLRVVDASVFPRIPGTFTAVSTYMVAEKAADVILA